MRMIWFVVFLAIMMVFFVAIAADRQQKEVNLLVDGKTTFATVLPGQGPEGIVIDALGSRANEYNRDQIRAIFNGLNPDIQLPLQPGDRVKIPKLH